MVLIQLYGQIKNILELKLLMLLVSNNVLIEAGVNTLLMVSLVQLQIKNVMVTMMVH